jgi:hypothetical protein
MSRQHPKGPVANGFSGWRRRESIMHCKSCLSRPEAITDWEKEFLSSLLVRRYPLSEKQSKVLDRIVQRIEKFATASYSS